MLTMTPRDERPWFHFNDKRFGDKEALLNFVEHIEWTGFKKIRDKRGRLIILLLNGNDAVAAIDFLQEQQHIFILKILKERMAGEK